MRCFYLQFATGLHCEVPLRALWERFQTGPCCYSGMSSYAGCRELAEDRLAGITQELREQERVLTGRFDASEASWTSLHASLQADSCVAPRFDH